MNNLETAIIIALLVLATVLSRSSIWLAGSRVKLPPRVQEALRYAPACALSALIAQDLLWVNGGLAIHLDNPKLLAGLAATAFYLVKKDMLWTICFGMAVFTYLRLGQ